MKPLAWSEFSVEVNLVYGAHAPKTRQRIRQVLREVGALPNVRTTADLTTATVARYRDAVLARTSNPWTVNGLVSYLRAVCSYAAEPAQGYIDRSPFDVPRSGRRKLFLPVYETGDKTHHGLTDIGRVFVHLEQLMSSAPGAEKEWRAERLYALFSTVAYTGLRRGEALGLRWEDVDLVHGFLRVRPRLGPLKTPKSAAPVPCPAPLVPILDRWRDRCGCAWVFPGILRQGPWSNSNGVRPLDELRAAGEALGIEGLTFLSLRHSWATHSEAWGVTEGQCRRILRHTRPLTQQFCGPRSGVWSIRARRAGGGDGGGREAQETRAQDSDREGRAGRARDVEKIQAHDAGDSPHTETSPGRPE
jgi:integrase